MLNYSIEDLNALDQKAFAAVIGPVFEHSPWIADMTWKNKPFANLESLHRALCETVENAGEAKQLDLIRAHPDLVGRAALAGTLTAASTAEQSSAGLNKLTEGEILAFQLFNELYREKFEFPFVICARLNKKEAILKAFPVRLENSRRQEIKTALEEIYKIAWLRLADVVRT